MKSKLIKDIPYISGSWFKVENLLSTKYGDDYIEHTLMYEDGTGKYKVMYWEQVSDKIRRGMFFISIENNQMVSMDYLNKIKRRIFRRFDNE